MFLLAPPAQAADSAASLAALLQRADWYKGAVSVALDGCDLVVDLRFAPGSDGDDDLRIRKIRADLAAYDLGAATAAQVDLGPEITTSEYIAPHRPMDAGWRSGAERFVAVALRHGPADRRDADPARLVQAQLDAGRTLDIPTYEDMPPEFRRGFHHIFMELRDMPGPISLSIGATWRGTETPEPDALVSGRLEYAPPLRLLLPDPETARQVAALLAEHSAADCPAALR